MATVWFEGVDELNRVAAGFVVAGGRIGALGAAVLRKSAMDVERDAKMFCPVDTGNLRGSISTSFSGDGRGGSMSAEIGPTASYGSYVEFGTSRMGPSAFMGPALDRNTPSFLEAAAQLGARALEG